MKFSILLALALSYTTLTSAQNFRKDNADKAEQLTEEFAKLTRDSPCENNAQACVEDQFAQCVNGKFQLNSCGGGELKCVVLPLVNKAGTSITCSTEADRLARLADARGEKPPSNQVPDQGKVPDQVKVPDQEKGKGGKGKDEKAPGEGKDGKAPGDGKDGDVPPGEGKDEKAPGEGKDEKAPGEGKDGKAPGEEDGKAPGDGKDGDVPPGDGKDGDVPPGKGKGKDGEVPDQGKGKDGDVPPGKGKGKDGEVPDQGKGKDGEGKDGEVPDQGKGKDDEGKDDEGKVGKAPGEGKDGKVPQDNLKSPPANGDGNLAEIRKQNAADAEALQEKFSKLKPDDECNDNDVAVACVDNKFAQCSGGKFALTDCASGTVCAALPLVLKRGTTVACTTEADRDARLEEAKNSTKK